MPEYIERKRAIVDACNSLELYPSEYAKLEDTLNKIPAADVAPVVRCKDCKYFMFSDCYGECRKGYMGIVSPDDFCSYGEQRESAKKEDK